jgi:hypothetical protein
MHRFILKIIFFIGTNAPAYSDTKFLHDNHLIS